MAYNFMGKKFREMEKSIKEKQKLIESIVNLSPDILYVYDLIEKKNMYSNSGIEKVLGYTPEEIKEFEDDLIISLMHPEDFNKYITKVIPAYALVKDGEEIRHEYRMKHKSGEWKYLSSIEIIYNKTDDGRIKQLFGVIHDITESKLRENEIIQAKEAAEAANIAKSQFLANISHEIKTPLNGVMGMLQLIQMTRLTEEQKEYVEECKVSSDILLKVINDILDYSKIEAGKIELEKHYFSLYEFIDEIYILFKASIQSKGIVMNIRVGTNVPEYFLGDSFRLRQILSNLIDNAIKFMNTGNIEIYINKTSEIKGNEVKLKFTIKDTGVGIPEYKLQDIFKSFTQGENSTTRQYGGTGLGLSICRGLVEKMNGEIWAESKEQVGSIFYFTCILKLACKLECLS